MAKIISNESLDNGMYLMKISGNFKGEMGQFFMVRAWDNYPLLSRPLSIHDIEKDSISFLYKVVGYGTEKLSQLSENDSISLHGPYGNGYPKVKGNIALVGGGVGVAPLLLALRELRKFDKNNTLDVYLGYSDKEMLLEEFNQYSDNLKINVGGYITDDIDLSKYNYIFTCGPEIMMKKILLKSKDTKAQVYVSIEKRMACGVGACLVCTCKTKDGNKKTCKDGPVFKGEDVYYEFES